MTGKQINIYKSNQHYLDNPEVKKRLTTEINKQLPTIINELEYMDDLPAQIRITTSKLPVNVKKYISEQSKMNPEKKMSDVLIDILFFSVINQSENIEKQISKVIKDETVTQHFYLKETLNQIDEFLLSLKEANNL